MRRFFSFIGSGCGCYCERIGSKMSWHLEWVIETLRKRKKGKRKPFKSGCGGKAKRNGINKI